MKTLSHRAANNVGDPAFWDTSVVRQRALPMIVAARHAGGVPLDRDGLSGAQERWSYIDPIDGDPRRALHQIVEACEGVAIEDDLVWAAVVLLDPLLDTHWEVIADDFEMAMRRNRNLRVAYSCTMLSIPDVFDDRYRSLISPDEDLGHRRDE